MTLEEIQTVVTDSARMRIPRFTQDQRSVYKIEKLEDYLLACAHMRGDLEAARIYAARLLTNLEDQWEDVVVTNREAPGPPLEPKTVRHLNMAKRRARPDLYGALQTARQLKQDIDRQIGRLTHDESTSSRAYTFITGTG